MSSHRSRWGIVATTGAVAASLALTAAPASATSPAPAARPAHPGAPTAVKTPLAIGRGGAVSTVDFDASRAGLQILRAGGNAADAAVAAAAALGVTEPFSAGIGGGGYFVYYDARTHRVSTIDGRETAPARRSPTPSSIRRPARRTLRRRRRPAACRVGVAGHARAPGRPSPGRFGTQPLGRLLQPAIRIAERRLRRRRDVRKPDRRQRSQLRAVHRDRRALPARRRSRRRSAAPSATPTSPRTYRMLARKGIGASTPGPLAREMAATAQQPPVAPGAAPTIRRRHQGRRTSRATARSSAPPTHVELPRAGRVRHGAVVQRRHDGRRGAEHPGARRLGRLDRAQALHYYLEASRRAYADRNRYIGDPAYLSAAGVPPCRSC